MIEVQNLRKRFESGDSGLIALNAVLSHLKNIEPRITKLQDGSLDDKFQEILKLIKKSD